MLNNLLDLEHFPKSMFMHNSIPAITTDIDPQKWLCDSNIMLHYKSGCFDILPQRNRRRMSGKSSNTGLNKKEKYPPHLAHVLWWWPLLIHCLPFHPCIFCLKCTCNNIEGSHVCFDQTFPEFHFRPNSFFFSVWSPRMTNEPQAPRSNSSRLEVIPLQAVEDSFQAWNGNS